MNFITKSKLGLYIGVIFIAGVVSGGVLAFRGRDGRASPPLMEKVCYRMQNEIKVKLGLTDAEFANLRPIFDQTAQDLQKIHSRTIQDIDAAIRKRNAELAGHLTPAQREKLRELDAERCDYIAKRTKKPNPLGDWPEPAQP